MPLSLSLGLTLGNHPTRVDAGAAFYTEVGLVYDGATVYVGQQSIAPTQALARSFLAFVSYEDDGAAPSLQRIMDVNAAVDGMRIYRSATNEAIVRVSDDDVGETTITPSLAGGAGRYNVLVHGIWDATTGATVTVAYKKDSGAWVTTGTGTIAAGSATQFDIDSVVGIGGRSTGTSAQDAAVTIYRAAIWTGVGTVDVTDADVLSAFAQSDGTLTNPGVSVSLFGVALVDQRGTSSGVIAGGHNGSQIDLTVSGNGASFDGVPFSAAISPTAVTTTGQAPEIVVGISAAVSATSVTTTGQTMGGSFGSGTVANTQEDGGFWVYNLADTTALDVVVTDPTALADTYGVDPTDFAGGPVLLTPPTVTGTASVGNTLTAVPGLMASDAANGPPVWWFEWYRGGSLAEEAGTYTVIADDDLYGITVRQYAAGFLGTRYDEADAIALSSYTEAGITLNGNDIFVSASNIAETEAEARAITIFASFDQDATPADLQYLVDIGGVRLQRTATGDLSFRAEDTPGAAAVSTVSLTAGDRVNIICVATWDSTNGCGARIAYKKNSSAWVVQSATYTASTDTELNARNVAGIGGRNSGSTASRTTDDLTLYRCAIWPGVAADLSDASLPGAFANADGSLVALSSSVGFLGTPDIDLHGAETGYTTGVHDGSQGDMTVIGNPGGTNFTGAITPTAVTTTGQTMGGSFGVAVTSTATFTLVASDADGHTVGEVSLFNSATVTADNLLLCVVSERGGAGHANHGLTDSNGGTWTKVAYHDQEIADANARHSVSVWRHIATATDASTGLSVTTTAGGQATSNLLVEISADESYGYVFDTFASADSGTSDWNTTNSGNATAASNNSLIVKVASGRQGTAPDNVTLGADSEAQNYQGSNQITQVLGILTSAQDAGTYSTTIDDVSNPGGCEGAALTLVFGAS